jgi:hypothetical protein
LKGGWFDLAGGRIARLKEQSWFTGMRGKEQKKLSDLANGAVKGLLKRRRRV